MSWRRAARASLIGVGLQAILLVLVLLTGAPLVVHFVAGMIVGLAVIWWASEPRGP